MLHPISRTIIGFYNLTNEFEIVEWVTRASAFKNRTVLLPDLLARAFRVLQYVVTDLGPSGLLPASPDILTFKIAKAAFLIVKVSIRNNICNIDQTSDKLAAMLFDSDYRTSP